MKAIVLCAGYGTRMKPYTDKYQKTMIPLCGIPLLEYIIKGIKSAGWNDFILVVGYRKEQIIDHFQDGTQFDINIEYVEQKEMNGTGGALLLCEPFIKKPHFFLTWGDTLVVYDVYKKVFDVFQKESPDYVLVTNMVADPYRGAAIYCEGKHCLDIIEKPPKGASSTNLNNTGVFILSRDIFEILRNQPTSIRGEIEVPQAIQSGLKEKNWRIRLIKMEKDQFFADFGNIEDYERYKDDEDLFSLL